MAMFVAAVGFPVISNGSVQIIVGAGVPAPGNSSVGSNCCYGCLVLRRTAAGQKNLQIFSRMLTQVCQQNRILRW
jgi:hypothetical protein